MHGHCKILLMTIIFFSLLNGQSDTLYSLCEENLADYYSFHKKLSSVDMSKNSKNLYFKLTREYTEIRRVIGDADCDQDRKDSINILLTHWFAKKVVLEKGDLPTYIALLRETNEKSKAILDTRDFEDGSESEDFYRKNRDAYMKESERLEEEYGELVIAFERSKRLTNMGVVKNSKDQPVEIRITPPNGKLDVKESRQRLRHIESSFELDFSEPDTDMGYIKKIEYFPKTLSSNSRKSDTHIIDSFAFTFDRKKRYRTNMTDGQYDTLYIKKEMDWKVIKQTPENTVILNLPKGLQYGDPRVSDASRPDIMDERESKIYLRPGVDNVEIPIVDHSFNDKLYLGLRLILVAIATIIPILIL